MDVLKYSSIISSCILSISRPTASDLQDLLETHPRCNKFAFFNRVLEVLYPIFELFHFLRIYFWLKNLLYEFIILVLHFDPLLLLDLSQLLDFLLDFFLLD